jgi:hypothetical protein
VSDLKSNLRDTAADSSRSVTSFPSARRKIARAREHMEALDQGIERFLEAEPYEVSRVLHGEGRIHEYVLTRYTDAPEDFGVIIGDAVHNLRSALDHVAFTLAKAGADSAGVTMTLQEETRIQFPICSTADDFKQQLGRGRLKYVESNLQTLIELYQPYRTRASHPERSVLGALARLNNTDKHHTLATTSYVVSETLNALPAGIDRPIIETPPNVWELGTVFTRYTFSRPLPDVHMHGPAEFSIAIDDAWPPTKRANKTLELYAEWIEVYLLGQL